VAYCRGTQIFQISTRHLEILGARRVAWSKFCTWYPQIIGITVQKLVALASWCPGFVPPRLNVKYCFLIQVKGLRKTMKNLNHYSWYLARELNPWLHKQEACVLITQLWCSVVPLLRPLLFWDVMQHWLAVCYQHFGAAYCSHPQGSSSQNISSWHSSKTAWPLKMGLISCPKTLVTNY